MRFGFREVEQVLATANAIPEDRRRQFSARLRNLFRVGLGLPEGRVGRRNNYDPESLLKLALAVELMQLGLMPEKIPGAVDSYWLVFRGYIAAVRLHEKAGGSLPAYLFLEPEFMTVGGFKSEIFAKIYPQPGKISKVISTFRRAAAINVNALWRELNAALAVSDLNKAEFLAALDEFDATWLEVDGD